YAGCPGKWGRTGRKKGTQLLGDRPSLPHQAPGSSSGKMPEKRRDSLCGGGPGGLSDGPVRAGNGQLFPLCPAPGGRDGGEGVLQAVVGSGRRPGERYDSGGRSQEVSGRSGLGCAEKDPGPMV